jgi:hypothetical protein
MKIVEKKNRAAGGGLLLCGSGAKEHETIHYIQFTYQPERAL